MYAIRGKFYLCNEDKRENVSQHGFIVTWNSKIRTLKNIKTRYEMILKQN